LIIYIMIHQSPYFIKIIDWRDMISII